MVGALPPLDQLEIVVSRFRFDSPWWRVGFFVFSSSSLVIPFSIFHGGGRGFLIFVISGEVEEGMIHDGDDDDAKMETQP